MIFRKKSVSPFSKITLADRTIIVLVLLAYLVFQFPFLNLDLWNDEIYTLKHFTFVSPLQTVTDYHVPNNHIFFNLVNHFYLLLIGEESVYSLMDHPWVLRVFTLVYALGTIFFTYKCAEKIMGRKGALLSIIILCTTIPFYNFAVEIRGYCLAAFLLSAIAYFTFRFLETSSRISLCIIVIASAAAVYTIPLCLYSMASILIFLGAMVIMALIKKSSTEEDRVNRIHSLRIHISVMVAITSGVLLSMICYAIIFDLVFFNEYVVPDTAFDLAGSGLATQKVFVAFFTHRYWLFPLIAAGLFATIYQLIVSKNYKAFVSFYFLAIMLVFPFVVSLLRKDAAPDRTYVNLIPFFSMLIAWMINGLFVFVTVWKGVIINASVALYCFVILSLQQKAVGEHLLNDIQTSRRSHDIYFNYYLQHFRPLSVVSNFKATAYNDSSFVVIRDSEPHDLPEYLNKFGIPYHDFSLINSTMMAGKKVYLFSRYTNEVMSAFFQMEHSCRTKLVSEGISYHNLFELEGQKNP